MPKQGEKPARPKVTIIPGRGVSQTINYLLEDRDDLEWLVAVGRNKNGEIFFYDTGGVGPAFIGGGGGGGGGVVVVGGGGRAFASASASASARVHVGVHGGFHGRAGCGCHGGRGRR